MNLSPPAYESDHHSPDVAVNFCLISLIASMQLIGACPDVLRSASILRIRPMCCSDLTSGSEKPGRSYIGPMNMALEAAKCQKSTDNNTLVAP